MSSVRRSVVVLPLLACAVACAVACVAACAVGCASAQTSSAPAAATEGRAVASASSSPGASGASSAAAASAEPPPPKCRYAVRRLSASGSGALRPQVASSADGFAVAWEETTDHRSIRVQTFGADAQPLGSSIEVADVGKAAAAPRIAAGADGDGFAVFWSSAHGDTSSAIYFRKIDRAGKPRSDAIPVVVIPGARALDALATDSGYALAWWNWSGTPHQIAVTFLDKSGRPVGKPISLSRAPVSDPTVDLANLPAPSGAAPAPAIAWDEAAADGDHVFVSAPFRERLDHRIDLGPGEAPSVGGAAVVWQRASDTSIWMAAVDGSPPLRVIDGHLPAAAPRRPGVSAFCWLRDTDPSEAHHVDELQCGNLVAGAQLLSPTRVAVEPRGIFDLHVAALGERTGATWVSQQDDDTGVSFAVVTCPGVAVAKARP